MCLTLYSFFLCFSSLPSDNDDFISSSTHPLPASPTACPFLDLVMNLHLPSHPYLHTPVTSAQLRSHLPVPWPPEWLKVISSICYPQSLARWRRLNWWEQEASERVYIHFLEPQLFRRVVKGLSRDMFLHFLVVTRFHIWETVEKINTEDKTIWWAGRA